LDFVLLCLIAGFNPRARAGRDRNVLAALQGTQCFNPRARAGRDQKCNI